MEFVQCPQCGARVLDDSAVCTGCGFVLPGNPAIAAPLRVLDSEDGVLPPFFAVSLVKLSVMSIFTLGLYGVYWFYRNWQRVRVREQLEIRPSLRALVFGLFFCYPCFRRIRNFAREKGVSFHAPILLLTVGWTLMILASQLPAPLNFTSLLSVVFLLPMQAYVNRINAATAPTHDPNSRFTFWNWVGIAVGGLMLFLVFLNLFLRTRVESGVNPT